MNTTQRYRSIPNSTSEPVSHVGAQSCCAQVRHSNPTRSQQDCAPTKRRRGFPILCLVLGWLLIAATEVPAQNDAAPDVLLQRAIQKEMVDGELPAAIELYKTVASARGASRAVTASGLLHLGKAYEKLGRTEARQAYERIGREYSDQKDAAAEASRHLAKLDILLSSDALTVRQVPTDNFGARAGFWAAATSDGRIFAATDWTNGDLLARDMTTGETKLLVPGSLDPRLQFGAPGRYASWPLFAPNHRELVFSWYGDPQMPGQGQLWVMPNEAGGTPSLVTKNPEYRNVVACAWSPDGKSILARIEVVNHAAYQIAWISRSDGSVRVIKSFTRERRSGFRMSLSPDGRTIAYSARPDDNVKDFSTIYLLAADGSHETELIKTASINEQPLWTTDGRRLLFLSDRSGTFDLWSVTVHDAKPHGPPTLVKKDVGRIQSVGLTQNGTYYFTRRQDAVEPISIIEMTASGARILGTKPRVLERLVGAGPTWSPDGRFLAFQRIPSATGNRSDPRRRDPVRILHSIETGVEKAYTRPGMVNGPARWLPDSTGFLETVQDEEGVNSLYRVDVKTGEFKHVHSFGPSPSTGHIGQLSPDARLLYLNGKTGNRPDRIAVIDLTTGQESTAFRSSGAEVTGFRVSPDGQKLALRIHDEKAKQVCIAQVSVDGKNYQELYRASSAEMPQRIPSWTRDGKGILFLALGQTANQKRLMCLPTAGGNPEYTGIEVSDLMWFDLNSDGTRIAFSHLDQYAVELWALENVPSVFKDSK
jgi:Tol biopolymer transport system component